MKEESTSASQNGGRIGPGRLVLVVGPSGVGKDTLIALAEEQCKSLGNVFFVRRIVTREASVFENNDQLSIDDFHAAVARGDFALHWQAHGHCYGLPRSIDAAIRSGHAVVANVSRSVIGSARVTYADVVVVAITAPAAILAQRLAQRARASDGVISKRLDRVVTEADAAPDRLIENVGDAAPHAAELVHIIRDEA